MPMTGAPGPICVACGTEFPADPPPASCPICDDERQFVPAGGQAWTSMEALARDHRVEWSDEAPGIHQLVVTPAFAIGQRALLIETAIGNVLWDCLALLDGETLERIRAMGGLAAIAISHPHFYTTNRAWAEAFDCPVWLHADDADWVMRPHRRLRHWSGETRSLGEGLTLVRCGGHFEGATVLHWAEGAGRLFSGDVLQVGADRRHVSVMRSFPNLIPVDAAAIRRIETAVAPFRYNAVHGAFPGRTIASEGRQAVEASLARYLRAIGAVD